MRALLEYLAWFAGRDAEMPGLVERWCAFRTGSFDRASLRAFADTLVSDFSLLQAEFKRHDLPPWQTWDEDGKPIAMELGPALVWRKHPEAEIQVLLAIHTDVVYAEHEKTAADLKIFRDGEWLVAPGAADAKGGIALVREALLCLEASPFAGRLGWTLVLNPDEEIGSPGSGGLLKSLAAHGDFALLFEPCLPDGSLVGERKGSGNFLLRMTGRAAHAGREPEKGRNAIHALTASLQRIIALQDRSRGLTVNVGRISGGGSVNRVPDQAMAWVNFRIAQASQQAVLSDRLREETERWRTEEGYALHVHGGFTAPPKAFTGATAEVMKQVLACAEALNLDVAVKASGGVCDGNRLAADGLPNVDTLGPCGEGLHGAGERLHLPSLTERAKLTALVLLSAASGLWKPPAKKV